jgi:hypothetical protein
MRISVLYSFHAYRLYLIKQPEGVWSGGKRQERVPNRWGLEPPSRMENRSQRHTGSMFRTVRMLHRSG